MALRKYTFLHVSADQQDSLDVHVSVTVLTAESEEQAWNQVLTAWEEVHDEECEEYDEEEDRLGDADSPLPRKHEDEREVCWDNEHVRVEIVKLVPESLGRHMLAYESNG